MHRSFVLCPIRARGVQNEKCCLLHGRIPRNNCVANSALIRGESGSTETHGTCKIEGRFFTEFKVSCHKAHSARVFNAFERPHGTQSIVALGFKRFLLAKLAAISSKGFGRSRVTNAMHTFRKSVLPAPPLQKLATVRFRRQGSRQPLGCWESLPRP